MFTAIVEGITDQAIIEALCRCMEIEQPKIRVTNGKGALNRDLEKYNKAARYLHFLVMRDLDHDAQCAPELKKALLPKRERNLRFVIAVREMESWLLADRSALAKFVGVSEKRVPYSPESLAYPKGSLIELAAKSNKKDVRAGMVQRSGSGAKQGIAYASYIINFVTNFWRPDIAAKESPSLAYCISMLKSLSSTK